LISPNNGNNDEGETGNRDRRDPSKLALYAHDLVPHPCSREDRETAYRDSYGSTSHCEGWPVTASIKTSAPAMDSTIPAMVVAPPTRLSAGPPTTDAGVPVENIANPVTVILGG